MIADLADSVSDLAGEYAAAQRRCKLEMDYVRKSGAYPLLGRGDMNLYSLFVERAVDLAAPHGRTGLLTPSGIASDNTSKDFFRFVTKSGRLAEFIDFENKKIHFPDVHASFKFALSVIAGRAAAPGQTRCAFFIHHLEDLGYDGPPFPWDEARRRHLRCQLDALYFHLYGLDKTQTATILDTFPIVHQHDQKTPTLPPTRTLILSYHTAYTAGDLDAEVSG